AFYHSLVKRRRDPDVARLLNRRSRAPNRLLGASGRDRGRSHRGGVVRLPVLSRDPPAARLSAARVILAELLPSDIAATRRLPLQSSSMIQRMRTRHCIL